LTAELEAVVRRKRFQRKLMQPDEQIVARCQATHSTHLTDLI
jgi:hypothetical protein